MKNNIYVLYNNLSGRYGDVMAYPSDGFALQRLKPVLEQQKLLSETELCRIGTIDIETGVAKTTAPVRLSFDTSIDPLPTQEQ